MATANEIIKTALRLIQVKEASEPISASEGQDGLMALNDLIDAWTNETLMQTSRLERNIPFVAGQKTYTIGPGGDINVARPVSIENAFTRDGSNADWEIIEINNDEYQRIVLKDLGNTYPRFFYYRPLFPLGEISFWPVPVSNLELFINVRANLNLYTDINQNIDFAPGYVRALKYNLAIEIAPEYRSDIPPLIMKVAQEAKERIKDTNDINIPVLQTPLFMSYGGYDLWGGSGSSTPPVPPPVAFDTITETGTSISTYTETGIALTTISE